MEHPKVAPLSKPGKGFPQTLTLGQLKKFLAEHPDLPDSVPITYQRIEDSYFTKEGGWKVTLLPWETRGEYDPEKDPAYIEEMAKDDIPGTYKVITGTDGKQYISERDQYIEAIGVYAAKDDEGQEAICIHAHY